MEKVSVIKCNDYNYDNVKKSLIEILNNIGGIEKYFSKGDKVLLKANLLMKKKPEEAATTNPVFVQALSEILINYGVNVIIGDSPGGPFNTARLKGIYKSTGMEMAAAATGAKLNYNINSSEIVNPEGKILKRLTIADMINDVDKIINLPKLKTHILAVYTGAVKNMFGTIPGTIKAEYHLKMPNIDDFADSLIDICLAVKPVLTIMDGIIGIESEGPSAGKPRKIGAILASTNPYLLDKVACKIIGLEPEEVHSVRRCIDRGICKKDMSDIDLIGSTIDELIIKDFDIPKVNPSRVGSIVGPIPIPIHKFASKILKSKPFFEFDKCIGCGDCAANCPPKVIEMVNGKPNVNLKGCISCFCCHELCPEKAVKIKKTILGNILFRL